MCGKRRFDFWPLWRGTGRDDANGRRDSGQEFYDYLYQIGGLSISCGPISKLRADVGRYWHLRKVIEDQGHAHAAIVRALADGDLEARQKLGYVTI